MALDPRLQQELENAYSKHINPDIIQRLRIAGQHSIANLIEQFGFVDVGLPQLEQIALRLAPGDLLPTINAGIQSALQTILASQQSGKPVLAGVENFLTAIADLSPFVAQQFNQVQQIRDANDKAARMIALLNSISDMTREHQLFIDLQNAFTEGFRKAQTDAKEYTNGLKQSISQVASAQKEYTECASKIIESGNSQAYFDPLRRLGLLLNAMFHLAYVAPWEQKMYPKAQFTSPGGDPTAAYKDLTGKMYNTPGYAPGGPAAPTAMPGRPGGV